jgi:hypothetical protein
VTHEESLAAHIGRRATARVLRRIGQMGGRMLLLAATDPDAGAPAITAALRDSALAGVVIVGGYEVVRPDLVDVLDAEQLEDEALWRHRGGEDRFFVWSDDIYGTAPRPEGQFEIDFADVPVSRIPDAYSEDFISACLDSRYDAEISRPFGLRNRNRPYAETIYRSLTAVPMLTSAPLHCRQKPPWSVDGSHVYLVLHGDYQNSSVLQGEDGATRIDAFERANIGDCGGAVVLAAACWGGLLTNVPAGKLWLDNVEHKVPATSTALAFLARGAAAVGAFTTAHYWPDHAAPGVRQQSLCVPLHEELWSALRRGESPARAVLLAKRAFAAHLPFAVSTRDKLLEEMMLYGFSCLGLGW